jgi:Na+/alanine symporter
MLKKQQENRMSESVRSSRRVTVNSVLGIVILVSGVLVCLRGIRRIVFQSEYYEYLIPGIIVSVIGVLIILAGVYVVIKERSRA